MASNYASYTYHNAWLGKEFGLNFAVRKFGQDVVDTLPRYVKGKNKGNHKVSIEWVKVERGGWVKTGSDWDGPRGRVERRVNQIIACRLVYIPFGGGEPEVFASDGDVEMFRENA